MDFVKRGHLSFIIRKIYTAGREPCRNFFFMSPNQKIMSPNTNDEPRTHLGELQLSLAGNHYFCQCRLLFISYIYLPVVIHPSFSSSVKLVDAIEDMSFQCSLHIVAVWRKIWISFYFLKVILLKYKLSTNSVKKFHCPLNNIYKYTEDLSKYWPIKLLKNWKTNNKGSHTECHK